MDKEIIKLITDITTLAILISTNTSIKVITSYHGNVNTFVITLIETSKITTVVDTYLNRGNPKEELLKGRELLLESLKDGLLKDELV